MTLPKNCFARPESQRPKTQCRHCQEYKATYGRDLCWGCWTAHRHLYPIRRKLPHEYAKIAHDFLADGKGDNRYRGLPAQPTDAMPGTEEKVQVLEQRVRNGEGLWHPADATDRDDYAGWLRIESTVFEH
jgi:hypothetical protein